MVIQVWSSKHFTRLVLFAYFVRRACIEINRNEMKCCQLAKLKQSMMMTFWPLGLTNDGAARQLTQPPCIAGEEKMTLDKVDILDF